jgi:hypothetical protein
MQRQETKTQNQADMILAFILGILLTTIALLG